MELLLSFVTSQGLRKNPDNYDTKDRENDFSPTNSQAACQSNIQQVKSDASSFCRACIKLEGMGIKRKAS